MTRRTKGGLEREILAVLAAGPGPMTPAQVRDALDGELAYTTVLTVLSRLLEKGEVVREPAGRGYVYGPRDAAELAARRMAEVLGERDTDREAVLTRFVDGLSDGDEHLLRSLLDR